MPLNGISEMEYCLAWATTATPGDVYQFRVYQQDGTPLDVITVTPAATIMPTQAGVGF
jgi:hypothetical protein